MLKISNISNHSSKICYLNGIPNYVYPQIMQIVMVNFQGLILLKFWLLNRIILLTFWGLYKMLLSVIDFNYRCLANTCLSNYIVNWYHLQWCYLSAPKHCPLAKIFDWPLPCQVRFSVSYTGCQLWHQIFTHLLNQLTHFSDVWTSKIC